MLFFIFFCFFSPALTLTRLVQVRLDLFDSSIVVFFTFSFLCMRRFYKIFFLLFCCPYWDVCSSLITHFLISLVLVFVRNSHFSLLLTAPLPMFGLLAEQPTSQTPVSWVKSISFFFYFSSMVCQFWRCCRVSTSLFFYLFVLLCLS